MNAIEFTPNGPARQALDHSIRQAENARRKFLNGTLIALTLAAIVIPFRWHLLTLAALLGALTAGNHRAVTIHRRTRRHLFGSEHPALKAVS